MFPWTLSLLSAVFVTLTLLPLSQKSVWWVRVADFPRFQLAVGGVLLAVSAWMWLDRSQPLTWVLVGASVAGVVYQAWWIVPYTRLFRVEVKSAEGKPADRLRMISVNVLMTNRRTEDLLRIIRAEQPDIVVTLETNARWEHALERLHEDFPHRLSCPLENLYGMHLYSRFPLEDPKIQFLVEKDKPSMHTLIVLPSGRRVCLHCLHPAPPSPTENPTSRERDAELVMVGRSVAKARFPVIVSGDLNDVAWSRTTRLFRKLSGLLDPRVGRGMYNTYHAGHWFFRWPVDHFFHSKDFSLVKLARLPGCGSDHFPVLVELACEQPGEHTGKGLDADAEDHTVAKQLVNKKAVHGVEVHRPGER
jgi:endonuclease/exonuclease/phosphatase (EEP) superfamily protein YafD